MNRIIYIALSFNAFGQMDSPSRHSIGKVKFARRFANLKSDEEVPFSNAMSLIIRYEY